MGGIGVSNNLEIKVQIQSYNGCKTLQIAFLEAFTTKVFIIVVISSMIIIMRVRVLRTVQLPLLFSALPTFNYFMLVRFLSMNRDGIDG